MQTSLCPTPRFRDLLRPFVSTCLLADDPAAERAIEVDARPWRRIIEEESRDTVVAPAISIPARSQTSPWQPRALSNDAVGFATMFATLICVGGAACAPMIF